MNTLSLRMRLTIWYTLALLVVLCLFGVAVLWQQGRLGLRRVDRELEALTTTLSNVVREELAELGDPRAAAEEALLAVTSPERGAAILDARGEPLTARRGELDVARDLPALDVAYAWTIEAPSGAWRVHSQPYAVEAIEMVLLVAAPLADFYREQREVQQAMVVGIPIALLLAAAGGWWLAAVGLRPITDMAGRAARISLNGMEDLGETTRTDEQLGQLAGAFNGLVARLRAALQTQRQFMADASHELRTPVFVIRSAAEVTLSRQPRAEPEYREALGIAGEQARRVGRLVEDMLVLARADAGGYPLRPVDFYLDEMVAECRRTVEVLAAARSVTIRSAPAAEVPFRGDEDLLRRLVLNVLQNAVQHSPAGGSVAVDLHHQPGVVKIRVTDQGGGIPPVDRQRIFDRFVQLDESRRRQGTGLGLPIARWIAEAHGGSLELETSGPDGSTFCVSLPARA